MDDSLIILIIVLTCLFFYLSILIKIGKIYIRYSRIALEASVFEKLGYSINLFFTSSVLNIGNSRIVAIISFPFIVFPVLFLGGPIGAILPTGILKIICFLLGLIFIRFTGIVIKKTIENFKHDKLKARIEMDKKWLFSLFVLLIFVSAYSFK